MKAGKDLWGTVSENLGGQPRPMSRLCRGTAAGAAAEVSKLGRSVATLPFGGALRPVWRVAGGDPGRGTCWQVITAIRARGEARTKDLAEGRASEMGCSAPREQPMWRWGTGVRGGQPSGSGRGSGVLALAPCVHMHRAISLCTDVSSFTLMQPQRLRPTRPPPPKIQRSRPVSSRRYCPPRPPNTAWAAVPA